MFKRKKLSVKDVCVLAMLIALTVALGGLSGFLRIGNAVKFSVSFITVYLAGALFGALFGGLVGAMADGISYLFNPTGVFLWQLSLIEFSYGFLYGLLFYPSKRQAMLPRVIVCGFLQFIVNLFLKTYVLMNIGYLPKPFWAALTVRFPAAVFMLFFQIFVLFLFERCYIAKFRAML